MSVIDLRNQLALSVTQYGQSLLDMSRERPLLLVLLRHMGCPFCKEALADIARRRAWIERRGLDVACVHMADEDEADEVFAKYGLDDLPRVSDPNRLLYEALELKRGNLWQIAGPHVALRVLLAALRGHVPGRIVGDAAQLQGAFVIEDGEVKEATRVRSQSGRPDYVRLAQCASEACAL